MKLGPNISSSPRNKIFSTLSESQHWKDAEVISGPRGQAGHPELWHTRHLIAPLQDAFCPFLA